MKLKNQSELIKAVDEVSKSVQKFAVASDGKKLAVLRSLLPNRTHYNGKPQQ